MATLAPRRGWLGYHAVSLNNGLRKLLEILPILQVSLISELSKW